MLESTSIQVETASALILSGCSSSNQSSPESGVAGGKKCFEVKICLDTPNSHAVSEKFGYSPCCMVPMDLCFKMLMFILF